MQSRAPNGKAHNKTVERTKKPKSPTPSQSKFLSLYSLQVQRKDTFLCGHLTKPQSRSPIPATNRLISTQAFTLTHIHCVMTISSNIMLHWWCRLIDSMLNRQIRQKKKKQFAKEKKEVLLSWRESSPLLPSISNSGHTHQSSVTNCIHIKVIRSSHYLSPQRNSERLWWKTCYSLQHPSVAKTSRLCLLRRTTY